MEPVAEEPGETDPAADHVARRAARIRRVVVALLAVATAVALWASGAFEDPEATVARVREAGAWGVVAYLTAFALLQPFGISGHAFTLAAAVVWGGALGFGLALLGGLGAATTGFVFARYVAFDWVQARIPARLRKYEAWLVERGLVGVILFRTFTFTAPPAQLLVGTLRIPYRTMIAGTAIGLVPGIAVDIFLGGALWAWLTA